MNGEIEVAILRTEVFELHPHIKYQTRITTKRIYIDKVYSSGDISSLYCIKYTSSQLKHAFVAVKVYTSWKRSSDKLIDVIKEVEKDLDMVFPQEAIDLFESRILPMTMQ